MKLLLDEPGRQVMVRAVEDAGVRATSRLSYVECGAAVARAYREGRVPRRSFGGTIATLHETWESVTVVEVDEDITGVAVAIARNHPVRASDAIHLASALTIAPPDGGVTFACYDRRLWDAARALGMTCLPAEL